MSCPAHALATHNNLLEREDVDLIMDLCRPLAPGSLVVDLGAGVGTSALAVFCANPLVRVVSVDNDWTSLAHAREAITACPPGLRWAGLECEAQEAAALFAKESVDLLLQDTLHYYASTLGELDAWLPNVRAGAGVWIHDYAAREPGFEEIAQAVDEVIASGRLETREIRGISWSGVRV